jgi:GNAT superfamily N-acetyltransferase
MTHPEPHLDDPVASQLPADDAWVPDLIVNAAARRVGARWALLSEAERLARERGCWQLPLEPAAYPEEWRCTEATHCPWFLKPNWA